MAIRSTHRATKFLSLVVAVLSFASVLTNIFFQNLLLAGAGAVVTAYALMLAGDAYLDDLRETRDARDA